MTPTKLKDVDLQRNKINVAFKNVIWIVNGQGFLGINI